MKARPSTFAFPDARTQFTPRSTGTSWILATIIGLLTLTSGRTAGIDPRLVGAYRSDNLWLTAIAVSEHYAFLAGSRWDWELMVDRSGFEILDIEDAAHPTRVGAFAGLGTIYAIVVSGNHAYFTVGRTSDGFTGLEVIDVNEPTALRSVGRVEIEYGTRRPGRMVISGSHAYLTAGEAGVVAVDIADPEKLEVVGGIATIKSARDLVLSGNHAYVAGEAGLEIVDISEPRSLRQVGRYAGGHAWAVAVSGQYAYVGCWWTEGTLNKAGVHVVDVRDPEIPQLVGVYQTRYDQFVALTVSDFHLYATTMVEDGRTELEVINISDPTNPLRAGGHPTFYPHDVVVSGRHAYVVDHDDLKVLDISRAANPESVGRFQTSDEIQAVTVSADHAFWTAEWLEDGVYRHGLRIIAIGNSENPQSTGRHETGERVGRLAVSGDYAYLWAQWGVGLNHESGLEVIRISDPADPQRVARFGGLDSLLTVAGRYAYAAGVASDSRPLVVVDIGDPANPRKIGQCDIGYPRDAAISGNYAYVAGEWRTSEAQFYGLQVVDVNDPSNPQRVGAYHTSWDGTWTVNANGVSVSGNYAYVVIDHGRRRGRLEVIDVSDPANPRRVGICATRSSAAGLAIDGNYAYIGCGEAGLEVIDISNPANPQRVGGNSVFRAWDVAVQGDKVFVSAGEDGLIILNSFHPHRLTVNPPSSAQPLTVTVFGPSGSRAGIQRSTNLVNWEDWQTVTLDGSSVELNDESSAAPHRFYRAVEP